jgi:DtxR family Mn-dependent transcriptional regulator
MPLTAPKLSEAMEDYLEAVHVLSAAAGGARVGAIAARMGVKSPTVNAALKALSRRKLVVHEKYGAVGLTVRGRALAAEVQAKHDTLFQFLTEWLRLDPKCAAREACMIEHAISRETFLRLVKFVEFLKNSPGQLPQRIARHMDGVNSGRREKGPRA